MTKQTPEAKVSVQTMYLYMAMELSAKEWKLGFSDRTVPAGAVALVVAETRVAKRKLGLAAIRVT